VLQSCDLHVVQLLLFMIHVRVMIGTWCVWCRFAEWQASRCIDPFLSTTPAEEVAALGVETTEALFFACVVCVWWVGTLHVVCVCGGLVCCTCMCSLYLPVL